MAAMEYPKNVGALADQVVWMHKAALDEQGSVHDVQTRLYRRLVEVAGEEFAVRVNNELARLHEVRAAEVRTLSRLADLLADPKQAPRRDVKL